MNYSEMLTFVQSYIQHNILQGMRNAYEIRVKSKINKILTMSYSENYIMAKSEMFLCSMFMKFLTLEKSKESKSQLRAAIT